MTNCARHQTFIKKRSRSCHFENFINEIPIMPHILIWLFTLYCFSKFRIFMQYIDSIQIRFRTGFDVDTTMLLQFLPFLLQPTYLPRFSPRP